VPSHPLGQSAPQGHALEHATWSRVQLEAQAESLAQSARHFTSSVSQMVLHRLAKLIIFGFEQLSAVTADIPATSILDHISLLKWE